MFSIEEINKSHDRRRFDCGEETLNKYLTAIARQHQTKGISKVYVLLDLNLPKPSVIGYYSLTLCEIDTSELPDKIAKKYPNNIPCVKLGRLAVDKRYQNRGLGALLLSDAIKRVLTISDFIGIVAFFVDAKNDNAGSFYKKYGFLQFKKNPLQLFLPIKTIKQAL